jgi:hypothetical protein
VAVPPPQSQEPLRLPGEALPVEINVAESDSPIGRDEDADQVRRAAAVKLVEPSTYGYLQFTLNGETGEVEVSGYVQPEWWPAFIDLCQNTAQVGLQQIGRA